MDVIVQLKNIRKKNFPKLYVHDSIFFMFHLKCAEKHFFEGIKGIFFLQLVFFFLFFKAKKKTFHIASNFSSYRVTCHLLLVY